MLAMTATMPENLFRSFSFCTHVNFCNPRYHMSGAAKDLQQRNIFIGLSTKNEASMNEDFLRPVANLLKTDDNTRVCIFINFRGQAGNTASLLEDIFAESFI